MITGEDIRCSSKSEALDFMEKYVRNNPGFERYRFMLERASLNGEDFVKEELDKICPDHELQILEAEVHTFKIFMDGTMKIETAAMVTPYEDTGETGATTLNAEEIAEILKELNNSGLDIHWHG